ncbi:DDE superfamily endonuclease [Phytophthora infestans]|uniref:DDE superfamily endonuclease n=1 Tax=Phytophthora infestans TaxID=4787 RepID=A0A833SPK5_PHYIN|nr:DDE superfamily endonuclease [Phytophthora infestans]
MVATRTGGTGSRREKTTAGTFTRSLFLRAFVKNVVPLLNPWPLPRSSVILDNAKIHMYHELEETGARLLFFLPPYCAELNPIEIGFGALKRWIQRNANLVFPLYPDEVLRVGMKACVGRQQNGALGIYGHCGFNIDQLRDKPFDTLTKTNE